MNAWCPQTASSLWKEDHADQETIHILPRHVLGALVVWGSVDRKPGAKLALTRRLLGALRRLQLRREGCPEDKTLTLERSALGRPCVLLGQERGPSLSFTCGKEKRWAAMADRGSVGIDAAYPEEFACAYPFGRAFRPEELRWAEALCRDKARGAALVWSAKEAAVKAAGTGFNLFDPLEVRVGAPRFTQEGMVSEVWAGRAVVAAWARPEGDGWLSLALMGDIH